MEIHNCDICNKPMKKEEWLEHEINFCIAKDGEYDGYEVCTQCATNYDTLVKKFKSYKGKIW